MSQCQFIRLPNPKICTGDMNRRITILKRYLKPPTNPAIQTEVNATVGFQTVFNAWAAVKNVRGDAILDGVSIDSMPTHLFYTRYFPNLTKDNWIQLRTDYYRILKIENLTENQTLMQIQAVLTGDISKAAAPT